MRSVAIVLVTLFLGSCARTTTDVKLAENETKLLRANIALNAVDIYKRTEGKSPRIGNLKISKVDLTGAEIIHTCVDFEVPHKVMLIRTGEMRPASINFEIIKSFFLLGGKSATKRFEYGKCGPASEMEPFPELDALAGNRSSY